MASHILQNNKHVELNNQHKRYLVTVTSLRETVKGFYNPYFKHLPLSLLFSLIKLKSIADRKYLGT